MRRSSVAVTMLAALALAPSAAAREGQVLVSVQTGTPPPAHARLVATIGRVTTWSVDGGARTAARLDRRPGVLATQVSGRLHAAQYRGFCRPTAPVQVEQAAPSAVDALSAPVVGGPPLAVLDTGVDPTAPELAGRVRGGVNVVSGGTDTRDTDSHGTAVASIAAAAPGLVQGISPGTPIIPVTIFNENGDSSAATLVKGIAAAVDKGAKVINISGANPADQVSAEEARVVRLAIVSAVDAGAQVIAPTGNDGSDTPQVPAIFPHVLTVGSSDVTGTRADFSGTGIATDLLALGDSLVVPAPKALCPSGYADATGTSFAAPAVAGAAALLAAQKPGLSASQRDTVLRTTAQGGGGWEPTSGFGLLDVAKALAAPAPPDQGNEIDDDVFWVGKRTPVVSPAKRTGGAADSVNAIKDPVDVRRVQLRAGDRLKVTVSGPKKAGQLALNLWDPRTPRFGVASNVEEHIEADADEDGRKLLLSYKARKRGTYFLSVATTSDATQTPVPLAYKLAVSSTPRARRSG